MGEDRTLAGTRTLQHERTDNSGSVTVPPGWYEKTAAWVRFLICTQS
jgi:hypothetical protein